MEKISISPRHMIDITGMDLISGGGGVNSEQIRKMRYF